ncbi:3-keto-5-aminohexanoate cleavage protein [Streptomyces sp. NPDC057301]|uniref:3-keto-5-aminohexanoate cleavage protein n=1 Tax=Streptomyces sp. NPDC057301 TaxID=3346093 RepID=UPI0036455479
MQAWNAHPVVITAAVTGADVTRADNPNVPYTSEEIADSSTRSLEAGAAVVALHAREDDGTPSGRPELFRDAVERIRKSAPDALINVSTGGSGEMTLDERLGGLAASPDLCGVETGSMNFGDGTFITSPAAGREIISRATAQHTALEVEAFEVGHVIAALRLLREGVLPDPLRINLVFGVPGVWGMPSGITGLAEAGLLGPDQVHVHCNALNDDEWRLLAEHGAKVSISPETELNMGMGRPVFRAAEQHGIKPTLSCDIASFNSGDLFTQMRVGLGFHRWAETEDMNLRGASPERVTSSAETALEWTTTNAADAVGLADRIGRIRAGMAADIVVVGGPGTSQHPRLHPAGSIVFQTGPQDVRHVLIAGRFVKRDGTLVGVDLPKLLSAADAGAAGLLERVAKSGRELPGAPPQGWQALAAHMIPPA